MAQLVLRKSSSNEIVEGLRSIHEEIRDLFPELRNLLHLLLVIPSTSLTAERSFSLSKGLKSHLRSTMAKERLNNSRRNQRTIYYGKGKTKQFTKKSENCSPNCLIYCTYYLELFPELLNILHLLLVIPSTSLTAERSFSLSKGLKSHLRSTMAKERLNNLPTLHCYKYADKINVKDLCREFCCNSYCVSVFGKA
ncbi:hypothetical protein PR048_020629, partial [Dryococelus australis]